MLMPKRQPVRSYSDQSRSSGVNRGMRAWALVLAVAKKVISTSIPKAMVAAF